MASPTDKLYVDVQEELGLPSPALVEKDYHVVQALTVLAQFIQGAKDWSPGEPHLVFGGGTALCRGHRIIMRMSEDIDLKIVWPTPPTTGQRRAFRGRVTAALLAAGFKFDPDDRLQLEVMDGGKTFKYHLSYEQKMPSVAALRPEIQIELSSFPVYKPTVALPISSFVAQATRQPAEVARFPCAAIEETAAEKFVALTRRVGEERANAIPTDKTLQRHVYDLERIHQNTDVEAVFELAREIMAADAGNRAGRYPVYATNALGETLAAIEALATDPQYKRIFEQFQAQMVYGDAIKFEDGIAVLRKYQALLTG